MIPVQRVPPPVEYVRRAHRAEQKVARHLADYGPLGQERLSLDRKLFSSIKPLLVKQFHGKCAYCESILVDALQADLENYRPKTLYPWLAYQWENLLVACRGCNSAKGSRFPLEDEAARARAPQDSWASERPLLLNPCEEDPQEHLLFGEDGKVYSDTARGQTTIDTVALNRTGLVEARSKAGFQALALLAMGGSSPSLDIALGMVADDAPYAASTRQILQRAVEKAPDVQWAAEFKMQLSRLIGTPGLMLKDADATKSAFEAHEKVVENFSLPETEGGPLSVHYFAKRRTIERVQVKNFKSLRNLEINLAVAADDTPSWLMLLGENATGKSSLLKALALTLMGDKRRRELGIKPDDVLTRGKVKGHVLVWLSGVTTPLKLEFRAGEPTFSGESGEKVLLLGYGSTRLLAQDVLGLGGPRGHVRIENLFAPGLRLIDAETWIGSLPPQLFAPAARVLKELLLLRSKDRLKVQEDVSGHSRVNIRMFGDEVSLAELSDGYQSVIALAADVLSTLLPVWQELVDNAEGIVLIDELDAHLHPTWRMRMVPTLRRCFPNVQFITTSHDPLCLKGLRAGEVVVLRRAARGHVVAVEDLPSPEGMSVDQLLTSEHFGLGSTVEPEVEKLFQRYYALLARKQRSPAHEQELARLKQKLAHMNHMGRTRREQLMLEVIDAYLAADIPLGRGAQEERRRRMLEQLVAQWTGEGTASL